MVDPVSITLGGLAVAAVTKAAEKAGGVAIEGAVTAAKAVAAKLRGLFKDDAGSTAMLDKVEAGNTSAAELLAEMIDNAADGDDTLRQELESLVKAVDDADPDGESLADRYTKINNVTVTGKGNTVITDVSDSTNFGNTTNNNTSQ